MSKPDYMRSELASMLDVYQLCSDCYSGERAVKGVSPQYMFSGAHNNGGGYQGAMFSPYLPDPSPRSDSEEDRKHRYSSYLKRAVFYNVTRRTVDALASAVFSKYPTLDLNELAYLETDVDGGGMSLTQQAKDATIQCLLKGGGGLLADMPLNEGVSKANMATSGIRPTISHYHRESIINWRTSKVGAVYKLSLLVLTESYVEEDDGYEQKMGEQLLVLRLVDGLAESEVMQNIDGNWVSQGINYLTDNAGKHLDEIPFYFYGAINNDSDIDPSPVYDLAELNIHHFMNSADFEEGVWLMSQPTLVINGLDQQWVDEVLSGGISIGSRTGIMLPVGGDAKLLQAEANDKAMAAMLHKEQLMKSIGAKLMQDSKQAKTATESAQESADESNTLTTISYNLSNAYTSALRMCGKYIGIATDGLFVTLNTQFNFAKRSPQQLDNLVSLWQAGAITFAEMRESLVEEEIGKIESPEEASDTIKEEQGNLINQDLAD